MRSTAGRNWPRELLRRTLNEHTRELTQIEQDRLAQVHAIRAELENTLTRHSAQHASEMAVLHGRINALSASNSQLTATLDDGKARLEAARQRVAFDELFSNQLTLLQYRQQQTVERSPLTVKAYLFGEFYKQLPFSLSDSQRSVIDEVVSDLGKPLQMQRLIQGDVGSGKTVVAAAAF